MQTVKKLSLYIFFGLLAYMPLHIFLSTWLGTSFDVLDFAKVAKDVMLMVGFLLALAAGLNQPWLKDLIEDRLIWLIGAYAFLTIILALFKSTDQDAEILGVVYNLRFLLFFLYGALLARLFDAKKLLKTSVKIILTAGAIVVIFGLLQYFILPDNVLRDLGYARDNGVLPAFFIDDKPDLERIMSTVRDPNSLGSYLIIISTLAAAAWAGSKEKRQRYFWVVYWGLTVSSIWLTFSRSAWLGFVLAMAVFALVLFKKPLTKYKKPILISLGVVFMVSFAGIYIFRDGYLVQNVILHADESTVLEDPNELRARFWRESVEDVATEPLGHGPGTAGLASIRNDVQGTVLNENYYLQIATEVGVVGLALFLTILIVVGYRLFILSSSNPLVAALLASFIGLALTNFFVHIWSNEAAAYTWWGLAALGLSIGNSHNKHSGGR